MENKLLKNIVYYACGTIVLVLAWASSFILPKSFALEENKTSNERNITISEYIAFEKENIIDTLDFDKSITEVIINKDNQYQATYFDYSLGKEISFTSFIKENSIDLFNAKVKELLYLKYPSFIADTLNINDHDNVYYFKNNELIIYYYNYDIPTDDLNLHVNYNEIKDYLNITYTLDKDYTNEDGMNIGNNKKLVALTFDDGPGKYTEDLANVLYNNKAHATFFMLGSKLNSYKSAVKAVYDTGNEIAYHSYAHAYFKDQSLSTIKSELEKSNNILNSIVGTTFNLVRPPYGSINDDIKKTLDLPVVLWNIDTEDWKHKDSEYLYNYVIENVQPGSIVLFHDIHETSVKAIPAILKELYLEGYQVVSVSELARAYNNTLKSGETYRSFKDKS